MDAILLLFECELGDLVDVGDNGGRDTVSMEVDAEDENQPLSGWRWAGIFCRGGDIMVLVQVQCELAQAAIGCKALASAGNA